MTNCPYRGGTKQVTKHDPEGREYIGTVTLISGAKINVYMPNMGDMENIPTGSSGSTASYYVAAKATNMTMEAFRKLPMEDGFKIMALTAKIPLPL